MFHWTRALQRSNGERIPMKKEKKLILATETLLALDEEELSLVAGGAANSGQFNPAKCPSSGHPNCN